MVRKNTGVIIQARTGSSRFKNKILSKIKNKNSFRNIASEIKKIKKIDHFFVAVPYEDKHSRIVKISKKCGYNVIVGSKNNLVARYYKAAKKYKIHNIIKLLQIVH